VEPSTNGEAARGRCHSFTVAAHVLAVDPARIAAAVRGPSGFCDGNFLRGSARLAAPVFGPAFRPAALRGDS